MTAKPDPTASAKLQLETRYNLPQRQRYDAKADAMQVLQKGAKTAALTLVEATTSGELRDRITASRDVLDRVGVGKQRENSAAATVDIKFLTMALAGIAALAGRNVDQFGDMTDLQERLETIEIDTSSANVDDVEFEEVEDE